MEHITQHDFGTRFQWDSPKKYGTQRGLGTECGDNRERKSESGKIITSQLLCHFLKEIGLLCAKLCPSETAATVTAS